MALQHGMKRIFLFGLLALTACTSTVQPFEATPTADLQSTTPSLAVTTGATPTIENCYYTWANQALPDISKQVDDAIKLIQPEASGRAEAYGENCVYADGHSDFSAMETDFYIIFNVKDLKDSKVLGNWAIDIMAALKPFPRGVVPGGQNGFVEITFKSGDDQKILRIDIDKFKGLPAGTSGSDVLKYLSSNP